MTTVTAEHKRLGFIPDPDPLDWTHLPLMRTSERSTFTRCRQQWANAYMNRIGRARKANALEFGTMIHTALEAYYPPGKKRGPHPAATFLAEYDKRADELGFDFSIRDEDEEWATARELGEAMMNAYVEEWSKRDKAWRVVAPEMAVMVVVLDKKGRPMCRYLMQLDLLVYDEQLGRYLFVDHKTAKSLPDPEEKELDEQCGTYWLFGPAFLAANGYVDSPDEIRGFIYNVLRKAKPDERPSNADGLYLNNPTKPVLMDVAATLGLELPKATKVDDLRAAIEQAGVNPDEFGEVSKSQPPPLFKRFTVYSTQARRDATLDRIRKQVYEMDLVRKGKLGIYKVFQSGGMGACASCEFYPVCTLEESGADVEDLIDMEFDVKDPYEQYREDLEIDEDE